LKILAKKVVFLVSSEKT